MPAPNIETIVSLAKRRGFVYPSSDIYGGLGSAWDYGPMGIELYSQGFRTFEVPATQELTPKALQSLARGGVDGVLVVSTTGRQYDALPESASVRLVRTQTGETVAAFTWSNPVSSGVPGTPADKTVRKKLTDVARELVQTLLRTVPKPPAA